MSEIRDFPKKNHLSIGVGAILQDDKKIKEYLGDIDYYLEERKVENMREIEKVTPQKKEQKKSDYHSNKIDSNSVKKLQNKLSNSESKISKLEKEIASLEEKLAADYEETIKDKNFLKKYSEV